MNFQALIDAMTSTPLSVFIRESSWAFPAIESIHVVAIVFVVGSITIVDLRLLGAASNSSAVTEMIHDTLKWTWAAFGLAAITGSLMMIAKINEYVLVNAFWFKFAAMFCAAVNMLIFELMTMRSVHSWDQTVVIPRSAKIAGFLSLFFWALVIIFGRWIGFTVGSGSVFGHGW